MITENNTNTVYTIIPKILMSPPQYLKLKVYVVKTICLVFKLYQ